MPLTPVLTSRWGAEESWRLATYERLEGYSALRTALSMAPDELVTLVKDSGLRGRGGAGFPTGMKWSFIPQPKPGETPTGPAAMPKYLVVNADEGEPGTCKDLPLMMADPHSLVEGVIISAYAIRCHFAVIYVRGEAVHAHRRLVSAVQEAYAAGYLGKRHPRLGLRPRTGGAHRRRRLHLRRGDGAARLARGLPRPAAAQAAVPRRRRPLRRADRDQQRRDAGQRAVHRPRRRRLVQGVRARRSRPARRSTRVRPRRPPGAVRGPDGDDDARAARDGRRRAPRARAEVLDAGRLVDAVLHRRAPRRPAGLRLGAPRAGRCSAPPR